MSNGLSFVKKCYNLSRLIRIHQPIGFFLLLWPTLWGLWLSHRGIPDTGIFILFVCGAFCMRSFGCVINDYIDYNIDRVVSRTRNRPLSVGSITKRDAWVVILILLVISLIIVSILNVITMILSFVVLLLSVVYPYLKRYVYYPQIVLGILFGSPILMAFTAVNRTINDTACWLLFIINVIWTVVYDTQYALMDREDDKRIGVKSSAIFFGHFDKIAIGFLQIVIVILLWIFGWKEQLSVVFYLFSIYGVIILFIWQQILMYDRKEIGYLQAFLSNNYVGMLIFMGIAFNFY